MLKELVLMRHAHAAASMGWQADIERPLSPIGRDDAFAAGTWLRESCEPPDAVLCSPAVRTRETLAQLARAGCQLPDIEFEPRIYEATLGELLGVIEDRIAREPAPKRLWLIGHNPGLEQALFHLDAAAHLHAMPPAGIAQLDFDGGLPPTDPGAARIAAAWMP